MSSKEKSNADALKKLKGKAKVEEVYDDEEDEDKDFEEGEVDDDYDSEANPDEDDRDEEAGSSEPAKKKAKLDEVGTSSGKVKPNKVKPKLADDNDEEVSEPEIVAEVSGDDVDPTLIISGGRRARRGRAQFASDAGARKYTYEAQADSDEDSW